MDRAFTFFSSAFDSGTAIPERFTCTGDGDSPPLSWSETPTDTESLALVVDDPDAPNGTFTHWLVYNIPTDTTLLSPGVDLDEAFAEVDPMPQEGMNDFGNIGYGPPCPPPGDGAHRYVFRLYALDTVLDLEAGADRQQVYDAMQNHILAESDTIGRFAR